MRGKKRCFCQRGRLKDVCLRNVGFGVHCGWHRVILEWEWFTLRRSARSRLQPGEQHLFEGPGRLDRGSSLSRSQPGRKHGKTAARWVGGGGRGTGDRRRPDGVPRTQVSWVRRRDYHLITVGLSLYTSDQRYQVRYVNKDKVGWVLHWRASE